MIDLNDQPQGVRRGEELPVGALEAFLSRHFAEYTGPLDIQQFPGGSSNITYLLRTSHNEYILRRPPHGNHVETGHDMVREYRVLSKLHKVYALAPEPYVFCDDKDVIGAPFYLMERRKGVVLRNDSFERFQLSSDEVGRLSESFIDTLIELHSLDIQEVGLGDFGRPKGYTTRQVTGWSKQYRDAATEEITEVDDVIRWLNERIPNETGAVLVHNDFKYDNLILDSNDLTRVVAVLDWEMCTVGDPLMDLGTTLAYWAEPTDRKQLEAMGGSPTALPGSPTRRELAERYAGRTGLDVSNMLYYYVFGLFKIAVITQQIFYRYHHGHTDNPKFQHFDKITSLLGNLAADAISRDEY